MHRSRCCHNQVAVEEADGCLAAVLHPDLRGDGFNDQLDQFLGLGILVARLILLAIVLAALTKEATLAAPATPAAAPTTATTAASATTTTATGLAAAGRIRKIKL